MIFSRVHAALGFNNCSKYGFAIGGAAVSPETVRYLLSLDMKLLEMIRNQFQYNRCDLCIINRGRSYKT